MRVKPSGMYLNPREKIVLAFFVGASILIWSILVLALSGLYEPPSMAQGTTTLAVAYTPGPDVPLTPSFTPVPSPAYTSLPSPTDVQTALPSPAATLTPTATPAQSGVPLVPLSDDTFVIALLGIDEPRTAGVWRTDSLILAFIVQNAKEVALLSVPRDLWVSIPQYGYNRINTVDALGERTHYPGGGPGLLNETLRRNLGVPVDHYVRIDFRGFVDIIDAVGGVTVDVKKPIVDHFPDPLSPSGHARIALPAGPRHMDGHMALSYCRSRITTDDFDRSTRQRQVLVALWKQSLTLETLAQAPQLWPKFNDAFQTDLSMVEAVQLAHLIYGIGPENVRSKSLDFSMARPWTTSQGAQVLLPQTDAIRQAILDLLSLTD